MPLWIHTVLVAVVLLSALVFVKPTQVWSSDEGAIRLQATTIESGGWFLERPFSGIDPEGATAPIQAATVDGDRYAPFTKHPITPLLVALVPGSSDGWVPVLLTLAATLAAAVVMSLIAGMWDVRARAWTLWTGAIGTSLLFYGFTVLHHSLAALIAAAAVLALMHEVRKTSTPAVAVAAASVLVLPFIRREGVLFAVALGFAVVVTRRASDLRRRLAVGSIIAASGLAGMVANGWWARAIAGEPAVIEGDRPFLSLARVVEGIAAGLFDFEGVVSLTAVWALLFLVGWVGLGRGFAAHRQAGRMHWMFAIAASVGAAAIVGVAQPLLGGFVIAMPWLIGGLFLVPGRLAAMRGAPTLLVAAATYAGAVIVTQERHAGGAQWGGRYLVLALPLVVPVVVVAWRAVADVVPARSVRALATASAVTAAALFVTTVVVLDRGRSTVEETVDTWLSVSVEMGPDGVGSRPVWVSPDSQLGRFAWQHVEAVDMLMIPTDLETYLDRYTALRPERFLYLGEWNAAAIERFASRGYGALSETDDGGPVEFTVVGPQP